MAQGPIGIMIFVEDPGAANFVAPLVPALQGAGYAVNMMAAAAGAEQLDRLGVPSERMDGITDAESLLSKRTPHLVLVGTSENRDTLGLKLIAAARQAGLPSVGVVDGPANAGWRFRGHGTSALAFAPNWILVPDQPTRAAYIALAHPAQNVLVVGHPHYDQVREQASRLSALGRQSIRKRLLPQACDRQVITFVAEISGGLNPEQYFRSEDYTLMGRGGSVRRTDIVLEELLDAMNLIAPRPYLVLRLHPKNTPDEFSAFEGEIDFVSRGEPAHELVYASDLVIGMTSHLLLEAVILGCRTLAVLPRRSEQDWLSTIDAGFTPCVTTSASLRSLLAEMCEVENRNWTVAKADEAFVYGAAARMVDFLAGLRTREGDSQMRMRER